MFILKVSAERNKTEQKVDCQMRQSSRRLETHYQKPHQQEVLFKQETKVGA